MAVYLITAPEGLSTTLPPDPRHSNSPVPPPLPSPLPPQFSHHIPKDLPLHHHSFITLPLPPPPTTTITTAATTPAWLASVGGVAGLPDTNCWRVSLRIFLKLRPGGEPQVDSLGAAPPGPREGVGIQGSTSEPVLCTSIYMIHPLGHQSTPHFK